MKASTEQRILELLTQVLKTTQQLVKAQAPAKAAAPAAAQPALKKTAKVGKPAKSGCAGIHAHCSKYNPWRAYAWNKTTRKTDYIGAFPTIAQAKAARAAHLKGQSITTGTKAAGQTYKASKLQLVKKAA